MGCGSSKSASSLKHVVIIGGGYGGSYVARLLQNETFCDVTLIDSMEMMTHHVAIPRLIVEPEFAQNIFLPFKKFVDNFIQGTVVSINTKKNSIVLKTGKKISYDYLVISTGTAPEFPSKLAKIAPEASIERAISLYKEFNNEMKDSPEIIIIGGTEFAVELAGEIRTDYPDKKVTIIHSGRQLISDTLPETLYSALMDKLDRKEIDVVLNDHVSNLSSVLLNKFKKEQIVETVGGKRIVADLVISCEEGTPSTALINAATSGEGRFKVNDVMKVDGYANIFAVGEVSSSTKVNLPQIAKRQAKIIANAIQVEVSMQESNPSSQLDGFPTIVSIGRYGGVGFQNGALLDEDDVMEIKSERLYTQDIWKDLGLTAA